MFLSFALFVSIMLILLWMFQTVFLNRSYQAIKLKEIQTCGQQLYTAVRNTGSQQLQQLVSQMSSQYDICILIVTENGETVATEEAGRDCVVHRLPISSILQLYDLTIEAGGEYLAGLQYTSNFQSSVNSNLPDSMIYCVASYRNGEPVLILLNTLVVPINATVTTLRTQLIQISIVLILVGALIALVVAHKFSRPIAQMNRTAQALASGNYDVTFEGSSCTEISELAATLNYAAAELSKVERLRRDLIANVSHDLRTPLTMITAYAEGMRDLPGENTPENAQVIVDEVARLTHLVNDLLDMSRMQSGQRMLHFERFALTKNVRELVTRYEKLLYQMDYRIEFNPDEELWITGDRVLLMQALTNLVNNAIAHIGDDHTVTVQQVEKDGWVTLSVTDHGPGIAKEDLPYIWDRYYRARRSEAEGGGLGTGLGLSIVKAAIEQHGGRYGVQSTLGEGSTFWFSVPEQGGKQPTAQPTEQES